MAEMDNLGAARHEHAPDNIYRRVVSVKQARSRDEADVICSYIFSGRRFEAEIGHWRLLICIQFMPDADCALSGPDALPGHKIMIDVYVNVKLRADQAGHKTLIYAEL